MSEPTLLNPRGHYQDIYDQAFRFSRERLHPLMARMDDEDWYPPHLMQELADAGYLGITAPVELGGAGMDVFASGMVAEAMAYWNLNANCIWGPHENLCLNNLLRNGNEEQKARYIPRLCRAEIVGALGLTEPGAGSDALAGMRTTARRDGDDYVLNGRKIFISNGPIADVLLVYAKTAPERGAKGISAFIVEKDMPGFGVAQELKKMGWRGCPTGELVFDNCRVPARNLVGGENAGVGVVMSGLDIERAFFAVPICAAAQRCLDLSLEYAKERKAFGQPIGTFQHNKFLLADLYTRIDVTQAYVDACVAAHAAGELTATDAAKAKWWTAQVQNDVLDACVQLHGGYGFMREYRVAQAWMDARVTKIWGGTNEIMKEIIGRDLGL